MIDELGQTDGSPLARAPGLSAFPRFALPPLAGAVTGVPPLPPPRGSAAGARPGISLLSSLSGSATTALETSFGFVFFLSVWGLSGQSHDKWCLEPHPCKSACSHGGERAKHTKEALWRDGDKGVWERYRCRLFVPLCRRRDGFVCERDYMM